MRLYHISKYVRRSRFRMTPLIPASCMAGENTTIPRICVAPSIAQCLRGVRGFHNYEDSLDVKWVKRIPKDLRWTQSYGVYMVDAEPMPPMGVPDAHKTGELWLTKPHTFTHIGEIRRGERRKPGSAEQETQILWTWEHKL